MAKSLGNEQLPQDLCACLNFNVHDSMSHAAKVTISTGKSTGSFQHLLKE